MINKEIAISFIVISIVTSLFVWSYYKDKKINNKSYDTYDTYVLADSTKIEPGQVWASETEDPFRDDYNYFILEVEGDYVKFTFTRYNERTQSWVIPIGEIGTSQQIKIFTSIYKRLK